MWILDSIGKRKEISFQFSAGHPVNYELLFAIFFIFLKEIIFLSSGENKKELNLSFCESGISIHFIHRLHVILRYVVEHFNDYYSCLILMWLTIYIFDFLILINKCAENSYTDSGYFIVPNLIICILQFTIQFTVISNSHNMSEQVKNNEIIFTNIVKY